MIGIAPAGGKRRCEPDNVCKDGVHLFGKRQQRAKPRIVLREDVDDALQTVGLNMRLVGEEFCLSHARAGPDKHP